MIVSVYVKDVVNALKLFQKIIKKINFYIRELKNNVEIVKITSK